MVEVHIFSKLKEKYYIIISELSSIFELLFMNYVFVMITVYVMY